ncbi:1-deoxy-D-xylulose-5-phosphate reductoisomerase [uncultured Megasphaera sp.]|uniref:1-deoxy-D-xylulose-5-phosphate reductoisomerase n=1 Tax=uncultured Megasphaera sp. TaxID=165188 RepID=UPI00265AFB2F|nr:1-deoxy-D-xylulose-5-phosphate reductoisomerase [uncultured Megasphaera sp.]
MKRIIILGSTGSIGTQAVDVIDGCEGEFSLAAVAAKSDWQTAAQQILAHQTPFACMVDPAAAEKLRREVGQTCTVFSGAAGLLKLIDEAEADTVLTSLVGAAGIEPTLHAIDKGLDIALANKETLVAAGELVMREAARKGVRILPVDSEHGAVFQCLQGRQPEEVQKLLITASGGPHFRRPLEDFAHITVEQCLKHPTWHMGGKITIDSATMFNKGLEVIEAHWLFHMPFDRIEVVIQPQSIIHSMVEFIDGSVLGQLGMPDMRLPIQYAFTYPQRRAVRGAASVDWKTLGKLEFFSPDNKKFPSLPLAYEAGTIGGTMPCVLNGANEEAVYAFLRKEISFTRIFDIVRRVMEQHVPCRDVTLESIRAADAWARRCAVSLF